MSITLQTHEISCDALVAGCGSAGVPCVLAAAGNGPRAALYQDRSVLGGNASTEVRMHIVGRDILNELSYKKTNLHNSLHMLVGAEFRRYRPNV